MEATAVKTKWSVDPAHSELTFKVKHLMISNVKGEFRKFEAVVESNGNDFSGAKGRDNVTPSSIETKRGNRKGHFKGGVFVQGGKKKIFLFGGTTKKAG